MYIFRDRRTLLASVTTDGQAAANRAANRAATSDISRALVNSPINCRRENHMGIKQKDLFRSSLCHLLFIFMLKK